MKKHFKVLRYFLLPTLTLILLRWAYFLSFTKAIEIITSSDTGIWRIALIIVEISFYIFLYMYFNEETINDKNYDRAQAYNKSFDLKHIEQYVDLKGFISNEDGAIVINKNNSKIIIQKSDNFLKGIKRL